jgi:redox-sensitive bicupin YhaK (pirin superfamily)
MLTVRKSKDRGYADHGWLKSFHSFSFAGYYDPKHMGWGNSACYQRGLDRPRHGLWHPWPPRHGNRHLCVEWLAGAQGQHGQRQTIEPGEVQRMSAGTGVQHSEFNHAPNDTTHLLQIWIEPNVKGVTPGYEQKTFSAAQKQGTLCLIASQDGVMAR